MLERIIAENAGSNLAIHELRFVRRTFTGVGSFTDFAVEGRSAMLVKEVLGISANVAIPTLEYGLGAVAFLEGNELALETYCYGDEKWDGVFEGFSLINTASGEKR